MYPTRSSRFATGGREIPEKIGVRLPGYEPVRTMAPAGLQELLDAIARLGRGNAAQAQRERAAHRAALEGRVRDAGAGGQLELSGSPARSIKHVRAEIEAHLAAGPTRLARNRLAGGGLPSVRSSRRRAWMPKGRYAAMSPSLGGPRADWRWT